MPRTFSAIIVAFVMGLSSVFLQISTASAATTPCATWVHIVDISDNNKHPLNWVKLAKSGVAGVYIKNSEGTSYVNEFWNSDVASATLAGLPYGGYYFAQPAKTDPTASANFFVASGGAKGALPPALDLEKAGKSPSATVTWAITWLNRVRALTNRTPILYTGAFQSWSGSLAFAGWTLWLPAYPNGYKPVGSVCALSQPKLPPAWAHTGWTLWQYTSVGMPAGTYNHTDLSVAPAEWNTKWTGAGTVTTPSGNVVPAYSTGSYGVKVSQIQLLLISKGLLPKGSADGVFGLATKRAVELWQIKIGVKGDGVWSVATQKASDYYIAHGYTAQAAAGWAAMGAEMKPLPDINFSYATPTTTTTIKGKK